MRQGGATVNRRWHIWKSEAPTWGYFYFWRYPYGYKTQKAQTGRSISHWVDKYGDYQMAWHHGILYHLESWVELAEVSTVVRTHSPEMATAIGEFIDYHLDR